jgi:hypothetical protein
MGTNVVQEPTGSIFQGKKSMLLVLIQQKEEWNLIQSTSSYVHS